MINQLYNEDCLLTMERMPENYIDLVVTSPPYDNLRKYDENSGWQENEWDVTWKKILKSLYRVMKPGGVVVWVVNDATLDGSESLTSMEQSIYAVKTCGFKQHDTMIYLKANAPPLTHNRYEQKWEYMFVWSKGKPKTFNPIRVPLKKKPKDAKFKANAKNRRYDNDAVRVRTEDEVYKHKYYRIDDNIWTFVPGKSYGIGNQHPAIFPEELVAKHVQSWSNKGDVVYDPFLGGGTTTKIAMILGRDYIGSEISKEFFEISQKRMVEPDTGVYKLAGNVEKGNKWGFNPEVDIDSLVQGNTLVSNEMEEE